ncbi:MAG TPA: hypothetical protein PLG20_09005, partial [Candidatus Syntrophosphaera sp.]|nr:hypothetical protein [Candidatus Syntrophosphaera sp.]
WYDFYYYYSSPTNNPTGPASGSNRVDRGGSYVDGWGAQRVSARFNWMPYENIAYVGFRLCISVNAQ